MHSYYLIVPSSKEYYSSEMVHFDNPWRDARHYICPSVQKYTKVALRVTSSVPFALRDGVFLSPKMCKDIYDRCKANGLDLHHALEDIVENPQNFTEDASLTLEVASIFHDFMFDGISKTYIVLT